MGLVSLYYEPEFGGIGISGTMDVLEFWELNYNEDLVVGASEDDWTLSFEDFVKDYFDD